MTAYDSKQTSGSSWQTPTPQPLYRAQQHSVLREVRKYFIHPVDSSVWSFLAEHRTVVQVLLDSVHHLKKHFGDATRFSLVAPIDESGRQTLYAVVLWPGKIHDVRVALAGFDDEWWIANSRQAAGDLTFTYELV